MIGFVDMSSGKDPCGTKVDMLRQRTNHNFNYKGI
jgi:hypothetical protein